MNSVGDSVALIWGRPAPSQRRGKLGKLVQFERRAQGRAPGRPDRSTKAEILIFTGVRYEREAPVAPDVPSKPTPSRGVKRKRG
jgi:hypothetical protein